MNLNLRIAALMLIALVGGCQSGAMSSSAGSSNAAHGKTMIRTELTFGAGRSDGANVSDWAWQAFVDREVTSRFPDGFTVMPGDGQWEGKSSTITHEHARVLIIVHASSPDVDRKIEELREKYKEQFNQESVMRTDVAETVSF